MTQAINAKYEAMHATLMEGLAAIGVEKVETIGAEFDYNLHMAIQQVLSEQSRCNLAVISLHSRCNLVAISPKSHRNLAAISPQSRQVPSDEYDEGIVCEEMQPGFSCGGKLVRAAYVMVSSG